MNNDILMRLRFIGAKKAAADARHVAQDTRKIGTAADHTSRRAGHMGKVFVSARKGIGPLRAGITGLTGALGFSGAVGLAGAFKVMYTEATEAAKVNRQTAAVLKSTGAHAWITSGQISALSTSLSDMSGIDDELIQDGQNLLLTFAKIRNEAGKGNDIFNRTSRTMVDFAARFTDGKMDRAAILLGKALNDPVKGMTALTRVGVSFDKGQQDQIKTLVEHNDVLGAQKLILGEVNKQVAGQAKASTTPMQKLQNTLRNVAETLGTKMLPTVNKAATAIQKWVTEVVKGTGQGGRFRKQVESIWHAAKPVVMWFGRAVKNVVKFAAHHPGLVKVAAALWLAQRALKSMKFSPILRGIAAIARTKAGAAALQAIVGKTGLGALAGKMGGPKGIGTVAGTALTKAFGAAALLAVGAIASQFADKFLNAIKDALPEPFRSGIDVTRFTNPLTLPSALANSGPGQMIGPRPSAPSRGTPGVAGRGGLFGGTTVGRGTHKVQAPLVIPAPAPAVAGGPSHVTVDVPVTVDGQVLWHVVQKVDLRQRNRR